MGIPFLTEISASGHQALAVFTILSYAAITVASVHSHSQKYKYHNMTLRAVSLLREAARASLRADKGGSGEDVYMDSARARVYISAVDRLLSSEEVAKLTGVSLDELRSYVDEQLANARSELNKSSPNTSAFSAYIPNSLQSEPISAFVRNPSGKHGKHSNFQH